MTADPTAGQWIGPRGTTNREEIPVSQPEPSGWELMRSLTQMREDFREDLNDVKTDINGIGSKIDGLGKGFVTRTEFDGLAGKVEEIVERTDKRTDRNVTIWLAIGVAAFSSLVSILLFVFGVLTK